MRCRFKWLQSASMRLSKHWITSKQSPGRAPQWCCIFRLGDKTQIQLMQRRAEHHGCAAQSLTRVSSSYLSSCWRQWRNMPVPWRGMTDDSRTRERKLPRTEESSSVSRATYSSHPSLRRADGQLQRYFQHRLLYPAMPTNLILSLSFHSGVTSASFPVLNIHLYNEKHWKNGIHSTANSAEI